MPKLINQKNNWNKFFNKCNSFIDIGTYTDLSRSKTIVPNLIKKGSFFR